jgi:hypothetical protein
MCVYALCPTSASRRKPVLRVRPRPCSTRLFSARESFSLVYSQPCSSTSRSLPSRDSFTVRRRRALFHACVDASRRSGGTSASSRSCLLSALVWRHCVEYVYYIHIYTYLMTAYWAMGVCPQRRSAEVPRQRVESGRGGRVLARRGVETARLPWRAPARVTILGHGSWLMAHRHYCCCCCCCCFYCCYCWTSPPPPPPSTITAITTNYYFYHHHHPVLCRRVCSGICCCCCLPGQRRAEYCRDCHG